MFHDLALARRLEAAHVRDGKDAVVAERSLSPEIGATSEPLAGGALLFCGPHSFLTHALGIGVHGPVSDAELDRLEAFYRERGAAAEIDLCPLADPTLAPRLVRRGFVPDHFETVLVRPVIEADGHWSMPEDERATFTLRDLREDEEGLASELLAAGFEAPPEARELFLHAGRTQFRTPGRVRLVASIDQRPVALGGMAVHLDAEGGVATLSGAATLPEARRRGIQTALIRERLARAQRAGADLAMVTTEAGSGSQRNAERCGFHPAYTRIVLRKER